MSSPQSTSERAAREARNRRSRERRAELLRDNPLLCASLKAAHAARQRLRYKKRPASYYRKWRARIKAARPELYARILAARRQRWRERKT